MQLFRDSATENVEGIYHANISWELNLILPINGIPFATTSRNNISPKSTKYNFNVVQKAKNKDCSSKADDVEGLEAAATKHVEFLRQ